MLSILISDREDGDLEPAEGPVEFAYQDEDMLVINKAAGVAVHPSPGHHSDTLGNFLTDYYKKQGIPFVFRPVNRLDRGHLRADGGGTPRPRPGAAEAPASYRRFQAGIPGGVPGGAWTGRGDYRHAHRPADGSVLQRQVRADGARAVTHYKLLEVHGDRSLVRLELETGRTHQIRVHMAWLGCPLAGDFLYGVEDKALIGRTALHSWLLAVTQPLTGERLELTAPLPEDMVNLL